MTAKELFDKQVEMERKISNKAAALFPNETDRFPITDGVCDEEAYLKSSPKVMWILKEPYDEFDKSSGKAGGGGWSIPKNCFFKDDVWKQKTWRNIIYIMQGIRNGWSWEEIPPLSQNPDYARKTIQEIAYINVSKMPNGMTSNDAFIARAYQDWKDILYEQISLYAPDVIIFGNTFKYFKNDMIGEEAPHFNADDEYALGYKKDGILLIDTYHPERKGEEYVNSVVQVVRENV